MASRTKIRDSVVSTLKDFCGDLDVLSTKTGKPEDKPLIKDKVSLIQKKIDIISQAVSAGKVANRRLPELMELCEIFSLTPDGSFEGCDADDVIDLLKQVSSKVAGAFELVCFEDWNLLPENRSSPAITPSPVSVPSTGQDTIQDVMEKLSVDNVEIQASKPAPGGNEKTFVEVVERQGSVVSTNSEQSGANAESAAVTKAQQFVQIAQRPQPKKPVVLFNPMAAKKNNNKDESTTSKSGEEISINGSSPSSTSLPVPDFNNAHPVSASLPPPILQPNLQPPPLFKFSAAAQFPVPSVPVVQHTVPIPTIPIQQVTRTIAANVADEIVMKVLKAGPPFAPIPPQPPVPTSVAPNFIFLPNAYPPPAAQLVAQQPPPMFVQATAAVPAKPAVPVTTTAESEWPTAKASRKKIRITDPTTGEEVDISSPPAKPTAEIKGFAELDFENVEPTPEIPQIVTDVLVTAVSSDQSFEEKLLQQEQAVETAAKKLPPGFEQTTKPRSQSLTSQPPSLKPPPGFDLTKSPKDEPKVEELKKETAANNDRVVKHVVNYLREKTKTGKLLKTEKVFAAFQKETGSDLDIDDFMEILRSYSAFFRFSATGSKIELVEIIELKIIRFIIAELVKMAGMSGSLQTLFDAYISTMRDSQHVIHVGSKFSWDEFCDLVENRAQDVFILPKGLGTIALRESLLDSICSTVVTLLKQGNDAKPTDLFARFEQACKPNERLRFFIFFDTFLEILTRNPEFHFANSRVSLAQAEPAAAQPQFIRQTSGGLGDLDDFDVGESSNNNERMRIEQQFPSGDLDCKVTDLYDHFEGNFNPIEQFVRDYNSAAVTSPDVLPVRSLPDAIPGATNNLIAEFKGTVSCVSMETRRVFIAFPRDPVGAGYSTAQDLTSDDDFTAFAQATIHNAAVRKSLPAGWCDIGHAILFYNEESDTYGRGVVMSSFGLPHCNVNVHVNVVESLTVLDIDTGIVHEKIPTKDAVALTNYREIPCLVVRCSFVLEPGALPPKRRSPIRFTLDTRTLYPPVSARDKPGKIATARAARIADYRSGVTPLPIIVLAP